MKWLDLCLVTVIKLIFLQATMIPAQGVKETNSIFLCNSMAEQFGTKISMGGKGVGPSSWWGGDLEADSLFLLHMRKEKNHLCNQPIKIHHLVLTKWLMYLENSWYSWDTIRMEGKKAHKKKRIILKCLFCNDCYYFDNVIYFESNGCNFTSFVVGLLLGSLSRSCWTNSLWKDKQYFKQI